MIGSCYVANVMKVIINNEDSIKDKQNNKKLDHVNGQIYQVFY